MFEDLLKHVKAQKAEADELRKQLNAASEVAMQSNAAASSRLEAILQEERQQAAVDRQNLLSQITSLVMTQGESQDQRLGSKIAEVQQSVLASKENFESSRAQYHQGMDAWGVKEDSLVDEVARARETLKCKLKEDWQAANKHNSSLQVATKSVHDETVRIVDEQMKDISIQMQALDDFVTRAQSQNAVHHDSHVISLQGLSTTVKSSYTNIGSHFTSSYERVRDLGVVMSSKNSSLQESLIPLDETLRQPLAELRTNISSTIPQEYLPTGETPRKIQYQYPTALPRTETHETLLAALRRPAASPSKSSPSKTMVPVIFNDAPDPSGNEEVSPQLFSASISKPTGGLREIDVNINAGTLSSESQNPLAVSVSANSSGETDQDGRPNCKRSVTGGIGKLPLPMIKSAKSSKSSVVALDGRENMTVPLPGTFGASTGRRRSPRT